MDGNKLGMVLAVVLAAGIGGSAGAVVTYRWLSEPLARLNTLTPVVVLDRTAVVKALPPNASPDRIQQALATLKGTADRLAASGYLVLDAGSVVAAPEDVHVRPER